MFAEGEQAKAKAKCVLRILRCSCCCLFSLNQPQQNGCPIHSAALSRYGWECKPPSASLCRCLFPSATQNTPSQSKNQSHQIRKTAQNPHLERRLHTSNIFFALSRPNSRVKPPPSQNSTNPHITNDRFLFPTWRISSIRPRIIETELKQSPSPPTGAFLVGSRTST